MDKIAETFVKFAELIPGIQNSPPALVALFSIVILFAAVVVAMLFRRHVVISASIFVLFGLSAMALIAYSVTVITTCQKCEIEPWLKSELRNFTIHLNKKEFVQRYEGAINSKLAVYDASTPKRAIDLTRKWIELREKYEGLLDNWRPRNESACFNIYSDIATFNEFVRQTNGVINSSPEYKKYVPLINKYKPLNDRSKCK